MIALLLALTTLLSVPGTANNPIGPNGALLSYPIGTGAAPPAGDSLLLVNATDHVLLVNASDNLCLVTSSSC